MRVQLVQGLGGNPQHAGELPYMLLLVWVLPWCSSVLLQLQDPLVLGVELGQMTGKTEPRAPRGRCAAEESWVW